MKKKTKLTTRQHRLADFIEASDGRRLSKREIYENVPGYEWHENASDKCPTIRTDMKAINASSERDVTIVFDHQEYYYATQEEVLDFIERKRRTIRECSREIYALKKKLARNGQGKVLNNQLNPLDKNDEEFHTTIRG